MAIFYCCLLNQSCKEQRAEKHMDSFKKQKKAILDPKKITSNSVSHFRLPIIETVYYL